MHCGKAAIWLLIITSVLSAGALAAETGAQAAVEDFDQDGVIDDNDACPQTPAGAIIVDPLDNIDYAGCTCEQVRALVDAQNPCVELYCFQKLLTIRYDAVERRLVDCPEDYCEGYTLVDYPRDGYAGCVEGALKEHSCEPSRQERSSTCGYEPPSEEDEAPVAATKDSTLHLTEATINYTYTSVAREREEASLNLTFTTESSGIALDPLLLTGSGEEVSLEDVQCDDVEDAHVCTGTWRLPTGEVGVDELTLSIGYTTADGSVRQNFSLPFEVREKAFTARTVPEEVITASTPHEEVLARAIHDEYAELGTGPFQDVDSFLAGIGLAAEHVRTTKEYSYDSERDRTKVSLFVTPEEGVIAKNLVIIEYIPKEAASSTSEIVFTTRPHEVLNDDPLVMWSFSTTDERLDLSYELKGEVSATGNTVVAAEGFENEDSAWLIIIPLLMIPLLVILLLIVPRMVRHER